MPRKHDNKRIPTRGWDPVANWYDGWMGELGSHHHQRLAIPAALDLLALERGEQVLDLGCGNGALAAHAARLGARYTGIDISPRLIAIAQARHGAHGRFVRGDVRQLERLRELEQGRYDAAVFLLSIQDMNPLSRVIEAAAWALHPGSRLVIVMTHPCFRVPRQSGWGHDPQRDLRFRRVDTYLQPLTVPMKPYGRHQPGTTISFHRPLGAYVSALSEAGLLLDALHELTSFQEGASAAERRAQAQIPLFAALRARRL